MPPAGRTSLNVFNVELPVLFAVLLPVPDPVDALSVVFPVLFPVLVSVPVDEASLPVPVDEASLPVPVDVASLSVADEAAEVSVDTVVAVLPCWLEYERSYLLVESCRTTSGAISRLTASRGRHADGQADDAAAKRQTEEKRSVGRIATMVCE